MDRISLTEPYIYFEMKDSTNNFLALMIDTVSGGEPSNYFYQINHFKIDAGLVDFRDNTYGNLLIIILIISLCRWIQLAQKLNG